MQNKSEFFFSSCKNATQLVLSVVTVLGYVKNTATQTLYC